MNALLLFRRHKQTQNERFTTISSLIIHQECRISFACSPLICFYVYVFSRRVCMPPDLSDHTTSHHQLVYLAGTAKFVELPPSYGRDLFSGYCRFYDFQILNGVTRIQDASHEENANFIDFCRRNSIFAQRL